MRFGRFAFAALFAWPIAAAAEPALGTWELINPEGQTIVLDLAPCASGTADLCGEVVRAEANGSDASLPMPGDRIISGMTPEGAGRYSDGRIYVATLDRELRASMELSSDGAEMLMEGCMLFVCRELSMSRVD